MKTTSAIEKRPSKPLKSQKNLFFSGVLILTVSNILIKLIGALFKVPMVQIIGNEGMGYFNLTYTIYVWFYMISTAGLPVAVSVMISEARAKGNLREVKTIFKLSMLLFLCIGFFGMSVMMVGSHFFAALMATPPIYRCVIAIAPTLFFICISSSIRGYFQGYQNMLPTAVSQLLEALGKLILGIIFGLYAMRAGYSLPVVAAYSICGLTIGAAAGMIFLVFTKIFFKDKVYDAEYIRPDSYTMDVRPTRVLLKRLVVVAIPITISASVMSLTSLIDGMIIVRCLKTAGFAENVAVALYGNYTSLAVPMFNLPPILIYPISYSLIPLISASLAEGNHEKTMNIMTSALRIVAIIAIPCAIGLSVLSEPILNLLYDAEKSAMAAPLLSILALSVFFLGMLSISNAILQANGYERKPIISMVAGGCVKLLSSMILISIPAVGMYGAPIGTFLCYLVITVINFYFMSKYVGITPKIAKVFVKPLICSVFCAVAAISSYALFNRLIGGRIATLIAIMCAAIVYLIAVMLTKSISKDDILMIPKGKTIYSVLHKCRLM